MDWSSFKTHNLSKEDAFETLCNQLFETWCKKEYSKDIIEFTVVNGAGGDGGVESYALLENGNFIGLQAKWFINSIEDSQINQLKKSINTALKIRPTISKYIVCIPRNVANEKNGTNNCEFKRIEKLFDTIRNDYPNLDLILWNEHKILTELQLPCNQGISIYWFENSSIYIKDFRIAYETSKETWLQKKYFPELNSYGRINNVIDTMLESNEIHSKNLRKLEEIIKCCNDIEKLIENYIKDLTDQSEISTLRKISSEINSLLEVLLKGKKYYQNESNINLKICSNSYNNIIKIMIVEMEDVKKPRFLTSYMDKIYYLLKKIDSLNIDDILKVIEEFYSKYILLIIGEPGTGKTQGVSATSERLLNEDFHLPILIEAKKYQNFLSWDEIIKEALGIKSTISRQELYNCLISTLNIQKIKNDVDNEESILPKIIIMVDGLDECDSLENWKELIKESESITKQYSLIKFAYTARPVLGDKIKDLCNIKEVKLTGDGDVEITKLIDSYFQHFNIKISNRESIIDKFHTPLELKIFCELNRNKTVDVTAEMATSLPQLIKRKLDYFEQEFEAMQKTKINQPILKSIFIITKILAKNNAISEEKLINEINTMSRNYETAMEIISYLCETGLLILNEQIPIGFAINKREYFAGIKGYFDYAIADSIIKNMSSPAKINFEEGKYDLDCLNILSIILIQNYGYLITDNKSLESILNYDSIMDLKLYALRYASYEVAKNYEIEILKEMRKNSYNFIHIVNNLIIPLSRSDSVLGMNILDKFLFSFDNSISRDMYLSLPAKINNTNCNNFANKTEVINIKDNKLRNNDKYLHLPNLYVWLLSSLDNDILAMVKKELSNWAIKNPDDFFKLINKFYNNNDPQIISEMFNILNVVVHEISNKEYTKQIGEWLLTNVLGRKHKKQNMNICVRYNSLTIIRKCLKEKLISYNKIKEKLPPYNNIKIEIPISEKALKGTRMSGFGPIKYDLSRYVLTDYLDVYLKNPYHETVEELDKMKKNMRIPEEILNTIIKDNIKFEGIIIGSAYQFLILHGWNKIVEKINDRINYFYPQSTHGIKSRVMSVCEKYMWQFRNYIGSFLSDLFIPKEKEIIDYSIYEELSLNVSRENIYKNCENKFNIPNNYLTNIPIPTNFSELVTNIYNHSYDEWEKMIIIDNSKGKYSIKESKLLSLNNFTSFNNHLYIQSNISISSYVVDCSKVNEFVENIKSNIKNECEFSNPFYMKLGVDCYCYISPKEVCWYDWKKIIEDESFNYNQDYHAIPTVIEGVCQDSIYYENVFKIPNQEIRDYLGIKNASGFKYLNENNQVKSEYYNVDELWSNTQNSVLVPFDDINKMEQEKRRKLVWIIEEQIRESNETEERFGKAMVEKSTFYIGYFVENLFQIEKIYEQKKNAKYADSDL